MREVDPLRHCWLQWVRALQLGWARGRAPRLEQAGGQVVRLGQALEVACWTIAHLGSGHLGKKTLGSRHLGQLWECT